MFSFLSSDSTAWGMTTVPSAGVSSDQFESGECTLRLFCAESLELSPEDHSEPYTLQWFLAIEHHRHSRHARWIPQLLEFSKHPGETLLGLGSGLGTDWLQYARHGAKVIACSPVAGELALIRKNFELRGLSGRFIHAHPAALPLPDASVDVACISGLLHDSAEPASIVEQIFRVLKPGGKVLAVVPAKYNADYWRRILVPWSKATRERGEREPCSPSRNAPSVSFSMRRLRKLFGSFTNHRIHKRHLRRKEVPWGIRWLPRKLLERWLGKCLILKAFKPVTVAAAMRAAA